jgi:2-dehydropantoate 2-reductase
MKITIVGAGAIGGLAGAWMTMAGEDVTLVDRWKEHVDAIRENGLFIDGLRDEHRVQVKAVTPEELAGPLEAVFLACKSQDTREAVEGFRHLLADDAFVVSLQNGMNEDLIGEMIGIERVIGAIPDYGGALVDPGHLEFVHPGPAYVGELDGSVTDRVREVQRLMSHLTETELTTDIVARLWAKQVHMSQVVMTAMANTPISQALQHEHVQHLGVSLVAEAIAVADAAGIKLPEGKTIQLDHYRARDPESTRHMMRDLGDWARMMRQHQVDQEAAGGHQYVKKGSGMWWDLYYRRRASETHAITGFLVEQGDKLGVPVPLNRRTADMIYEIERGEREQGYQNFDELYQYAKENDLLLPA